MISKDEVYYYNLDTNFFLAGRNFSLKFLLEFFSFRLRIKWRKDANYTGMNLQSTLKYTYTPGDRQMM